MKTLILLLIVSLYTSMAFAEWLPIDGFSSCSNQLTANDSVEEIIETTFFFSYTFANVLENRENDRKIEFIMNAVKENPQLTYSDFYHEPNIGHSQSFVSISGPKDLINKFNQDFYDLFPLQNYFWYKKTHACGVG